MPRGQNPERNKDSRCLRLVAQASPSSWNRRAERNVPTLTTIGAPQEGLSMAKGGDSHLHIRQFANRPSRFVIWRDLIIRYELVEILPMGDWISIIAILETAYIQNPDDPAILSRLDAMAVCDAFSREDKILVLWQACV